MKSTKHKSKENQDEKLEEETKIDPKDIRIEELEKNNLDLIDTLKRLQAEFENYKKRVENQRLENIQGAARNIITQILPVFDNFEAAINATNEEDKKSEMFKGFEIIFLQLKNILEENGVKEIACKGEDFNPYEHEALLQEPSEEKDNSVLEVLQKGYKLHDKILRHAKVKIAKNDSQK